jgi:hypothetical protein
MASDGFIGKLFNPIPLLLIAIVATTGSQTTFSHFLLTPGCALHDRTTGIMNKNGNMF